MTQQSAAPGWYPDPSMADTQRYWDGGRWTEHVAPGAPTRPVGSIYGAAELEQMAATNRLEKWGWLGAFFFPIVGVVIGIVLLARPGRNQGGWILGISAGWMLIVWTLLASSQPTYY